MSATRWIFWARAAAVEHGLSAPARHLLLLKATYVDWNTGRGNVKLETLLASFGRGKSSYHEVLRELVSHGLVEHRRAAPGRNAGWSLDDADALGRCAGCESHARRKHVKASAAAEPNGYATAEPNGSAAAETTPKTVPPQRTNGSATANERVRNGGTSTGPSPSLVFLNGDACGYATEDRSTVVVEHDAESDDRSIARVLVLTALDGSASAPDVARLTAVGS